MRILALHSGVFGQRVLHSLRAFAPREWQLQTWRVTAHYPRFAETDVILSLCETEDTLELIPGICKQTRARAVIAPVEREEWLPKNRVADLHNRLGAIGVASVFPKPFCSLTESSYSLKGECVAYDDRLIAEFARYFGRPRLDVRTAGGAILKVEVERAAPCGSSYLIARGLRGLGIEDAAEEAGRLHRQYPCLASTDVDPDYEETLQSISGAITRAEVSASLDAVTNQGCKEPT